MSQPRTLHQHRKKFVTKLTNSINCTSQGSRRGYYKLRQHYTILYQNKFVDEAIGEFLSRVMPDLADGISAASLHCLEDIGYALYIGHAQGAVDAVAYLHHSHNPLVVS